MSASKQETSNVIVLIVAKTRQGRDQTKPYSVDISEMRSSEVDGRGYFLFFLFVDAIWWSVKNFI